MSSSLIINSNIPFLCKSKLSIVDEFNDSTVKFRSRIVFCSLSGSSATSFSKLRSVRHLGSSLGHDMVDWAKNCDHDDDEEEEEGGGGEQTVTVSLIFLFAFLFLKLL